MRAASVNVDPRRLAFDTAASTPAKRVSPGDRASDEEAEENPTKRARAGANTATISELLLRMDNLERQSKNDRLIVTALRKEVSDQKAELHKKDVTISALSARLDKNAASLDAILARISTLEQNSVTVTGRRKKGRNNVLASIMRRAMYDLMQISANSKLPEPLEGDQEFWLLLNEGEEDPTKHVFVLRPKFNLFVDGNKIWFNTLLKHIRSQGHRWIPAPLTPAYLEAISDTDITNRIADPLFKNMRKRYQRGLLAADEQEDLAEMEKTATRKREVSLLPNGSLPRMESADLNDGGSGC
ncbi:unnamed protein product [Peniophora sp. CBMAI 1063]|nr:unnamed protein product [Peniophora sp. CBMAI 1063]